MREFPNPFKRRQRRVVLDDAQEAWFRQYYPITENQVLADAIGVSTATVKRMAIMRGMKGKSALGMQLIMKRRNERARESNERNGTWDRKRGHPVSQATQEGLARYWQACKEGKRDNPIDHLRKTDPERYKRSMNERNIARKELVMRERRRLIYGLPMKTSLSNIVILYPYTQSQKHHRCSAIKRGYLLDADCSEGSPGRYVIYYDDETERSEKFEQNCIKDGFTIKRDG